MILFILNFYLIFISWQYRCNKQKFLWKLSMEKCKINCISLNSNFKLIYCYVFCRKRNFLSTQDTLKWSIKVAFNVIVAINMRLFIFSHAQDLESICIKFIKYLRYYLTSFSDVSIETVLLISIKITDFAHPNLFITYRIFVEKRYSENFMSFVCKNL